MKIRFSPEAESDLVSALSYLAERNALAAEKLARQIFKTVESLATSPIDGPPQTLNSGEVLRTWVVPPFRIFYRRSQNELQIVRVYHHARRPISR